jgi:hypothetical protein
MNTISFIWVFLISFSFCKNNINIEQEESYCLISSVYLENGKYYIEADYVQYLVGDKAIEAAKKAGDADIKLVDGEQKYSIPNDFYIINENPKLRKLELSKNVRLNLVNAYDLKGNDVKSIFDYFKNNYNDKIFLLKLNKGKVVEIDEIFTP